MPIPGPPPPGGAFGPVPVRLDDPVTDEEQGPEERERRLSSSNSVAPIPEQEPEHLRRTESDRDSDRDETQKRVPARRTSDSTHSAGSRRGSGSDRGSKRRRGDSDGLSIGTGVGRALVDGPEVTPISAGPSSAGTGWGAIDPTLGASSAAAQQSPSTPTSSSDHHYASAPAPQAAATATSYEHRYTAPPPNGSTPAPAPAAAPNYPYDSHAHHQPQPGHHYSAPSAPHPYAHVPAPAQHTNAYPYPPAQQAPPSQSCGYDTYGHSQTYNMPPPGPPPSQTHHTPAHPPPTQRYADYPPYAQQGYGAYYEHPGAPSQHHVQPSPTSHSAPHSYQTGYGSAPTPPSPTTNQAPAPADYYTGRAEARSASHVPPTTTASGGYAQTAYAPPPPTYAPPASVYPQYNHNPSQGHAPQHTAAATAPSNSQGSASSSGRGHYQLSTPPHHTTQPYSPYPPVPIAGTSAGASASITAAAPADANWGYPSGPAPAANTGAWTVIQDPPYAANYGGSGAAARDAHGHGPRLPPLRGGGGGTPPPGAVEGGRGVTSKKNPLSIGNIISEDTG